MMNRISGRGKAFITRRCPEWQVVGAARDGKEALAMANDFYRTAL